MPEHAPFELPEFTRSLRAFAAVGSLGNPDHDRWFAPLLAARTSAARVQGIEGRVAAFDAARLRKAMLNAITQMSEARFKKSAPDRRALDALLEELCEPAFTALVGVEKAAGGLRPGSDLARTDAWTAWTAAVQSLFDAADRSWSAMLAALRVYPVKGLRTAGRARGGDVAKLLLVALAIGGAALRADAQHVTLRVAGVRADSLRARGFDVVGIENGTPLVVADAAERARLQSLGYSASERPVVGVSSQRGLALQLTSTRVYRSYDDPQRGIRAFIDSLARVNTRVSVDTVGRSYEGRPMLAVKIGAKSDSPTRPNVLFMATYHAREWAATEMALRLITYLATAPSSNARVDSLLQSRDIWIIPVANPDGYQYTFTADRLWRKTRSPQAGGAFGVDMNRNNRTNWGLDNFGSSNDPFSEVFRGPSAASEIETRNIESFHAAHPPVVAVSYHTFAGLILFPPGATSGPLSADLPVYRTLAGTNLRSAVIDRLAGSTRSFYSPNSAWTLYPTNGEYNEWVARQFGTIGFTPEISSGYGLSGYFGFEFPDDEAQLAQLFQDNLPFALDVIESARDPLGYASPTTFGRASRVTLESVSPELRVTVPSAAAPTTTLSAPTPLAFRLDTTAGGKYTRRLIASAGNRPKVLTVASGGFTTTFSVLLANGAETDEPGWTATRFTIDSSSVVAGKYSWATTGSGELKSPVVTMPADVDTLSIMFWNRYDGSGFSENPYGRVLLSSDGGATFTPILRVQGAAPVWYPERATVGGVKGKKVVVAFVPSGMNWNLDEIALVAHTATVTVPIGNGTVLKPSENPVRRGTVYFTWPFGTPTGDLQAFDFSGHSVWKTTVTNGGIIGWDIAAALLPNGVYVVVARSGGKTVRLKLFVVRDGR
jgi:hypothetical protein